MSGRVPGSPGYGSLDSDGGRHDEAPRRIDADALALYLSRPSLALGLYPASPWADIAASDAPGGPYDATGGRPAGARDVGKRLGVSERGAADPREPADPRELGERLGDAVRQAVGAHRTVAVLHDGSLGATALLAAADAVGRELGVEVTVVIADHPGPDGASAAVPTQRVLAALDGRHRFLLAEIDRLPGPDNGPEFRAASDGRSGPGSGPVFRAASDGGSGPGSGSAPESGPPIGAGSGPRSLEDGERGSGGHGAVWNPVAPDLARTALVRAAEVRAARLGATLILTADGCEELLQAGPVALPSGLAGLTAVRRGLADRWRGEGVRSPLRGRRATAGRARRRRAEPDRRRAGRNRR
ncbi:hypothetical protein MTP10_31040, partial [Nonomuraea sp. 3-1Str]|nr:hypothetical protein [Nonomuraea sp. 3-1Str]